MKNLIKLLSFFVGLAVAFSFLGFTGAWGQSSQNQILFTGPCDEVSREQCELGRLYFTDQTLYFEGDVEECAWIYQQVLEHKQLKHHSIFSDEDMNAVLISDSVRAFFGYASEKSVGAQEADAQKAQKAEGFLHETSGGIGIIAEAGAVSQYATHWNLSWDKIDWGNLDFLWEAQTGVQKSNLSPENLQVFIKEWKWYQYPEETAPKPRFRCSDGRMVQAYYDTKWGVYINLGIDNGQGDKAFCRSPLPHEWNHLIL